MDIPLTQRETVMTRDHETMVQELAAEHLDLVAGGTSIQEIMQKLTLMNLLSNLSKMGSDFNTTVTRNIRA